MKDRLLRSAKALLAALLTWSLLTAALIALDSSFHLSEKIGWFPLAGFALPAASALLSLVWAFRQRGSQRPVRGAGRGKEPAPNDGEAPRPAARGPVQRKPRNAEEAMAIVDAMDGQDFERFCAEMLERDGYQQVHVTKRSGDQGVDIVAIKHGVRYAFQCKRYSSKLGNGPVQEVNTGKRIYSCQVGVVITNSHFTRGAETAARAVGVQLWDRDTLIRKMGW